jgi:hypothetical protein
MHAGLIRSLLTSAAALVLLLPAMPARADLYSANAAYQKGRLGWNLQPLQQRASTYASRQSWYGDLLNF